MHWLKGWQTVGLLGIMVLCTASPHPVPPAMANADLQVSAPAPQCADERQISERLTRDLIYRSQQYARAGQFDLAARSLDRALQIVATVTDPFAKADLVSNITGQSGEQPSTLGQLVDQAIAAQQPDQLLALLPKVVAATQGLNGEYGVRNSKRATLIQLARYYTVLQRPDQARQLLDQARELLASLEGDGFGLIASPLAEGYAALGDVQPAIAILRQAVERTEAMTTKNAAYLADIFSAIALAYSKAGAETQALQVTQRIPVPEVKARTLAAIAKQIAQTNPEAAVTPLLTQALGQIQTLPSAARSNALAHMALAHAHIGQWEAAQTQVNAIASTEIKVRTLAELANLSHRAQRLPLATQFLGNLVTLTRTTEPFYDGDRWLREVAAQYLKNRQYDLALQVHQALDSTLQTELLLQVIEQASATGNFAIARQALNSLPAGWNRQTRSLGWRSLATGYAQAGEYEQAIQLLAQITDTPDYPSRVLTQVAIAQAYGKNGQTALAIAQLEQALQSLQALGTSPAQWQALPQIAVQFAQLGQPERALTVQTQAFKPLKTSEPNAPSVSFAREQFITHYLKAEAYPLALQLVQTLDNEWEHDRHLQTILQQMLEVGALETVEPAAQNIRNANQKIAFWVKISDYYKGTGQVQSAAKLLTQALAIAQNLPGPDENDFSEAARLDPSIPIDDEFDRGSLITSIAIRYAELGQLEQAIQAALTLRSPTAQTRLKERLACYQ